MSRSLGTDLATALLLLLPAAIVFVPGLDYPFLYLDDVPYIIENPSVQELSLERVRFLFFEDDLDVRYFPLLYLSFALDHHFFGFEPIAFHGVNLFLHLANTLLVWVLVRRLTGDRIAGGLAALLFSVHPLQVESVAWIISRKNVLFLCFFLLSLLSYVGFMDTRGRRRVLAPALLLGSAVLYGVANLAKTAAITLPALLVVLDLYLERARPLSLGAFVRRHGPSKLVYLPVAALVVWAASGRSHPLETDYAFTTFEWLVLVGHNVFFYVAKTLAPLHLGVFYPLPQAGKIPLYFSAYALLGLAVVGLTAWSGLRGRWTLFLGLAWYVVTIAPLAAAPAVFSDTPLLAADRYFYQSSIGLFLLVGCGASALWRLGGTTRLAAGTAAALTVLALSVLSAQHRATFRDTVTLYEQVVAHHPSDEFYYRLALEYQRVGRERDAHAALESAKHAEHRIFFMRLGFYQMQLAELYRRKGDLASAAAHLQAGLLATPNRFEASDAGTPIAWLYAADLWTRAGDAAKASAARSRAADASRDPAYYFESIWFDVAPGEARRFLRQRVADAPDDGMAWYLLGFLAERDGDAAQARRSYQQARELGFRP